MYFYFTANVNVSCLPGIGIFTFHFDKKNYTQAQTTCKEDGGRLAAVLSELRTTHLANTLSYQADRKGKTVLAYIGLDDIKDEGTYISSSGRLR